MNLRSLAPWCLAPLAALVACETAETTGSESSDATEARGLLALAPTLELGDTVTGQFEGGQLDAYRIDLLRGDSITVRETITDGDAAPDALLFASGSTAVKSKSFDAEGGTLEKTFVIDDSGPHYIAVRAFKSTQAGRYSLVVECTGGPCAGDPIEEPVDEEQAGECLRLARECAFAALPAAGSSVGPVRARAIYEGCLGEVSVAGVSCAPACDSEAARRICDDAIGMLPFYADQSSACHARLGGCMETCYEAGADAGGLDEGSEAMCLLDGFNSTCDGYARGHVDCGGTYADETLEECHAACEASFGVWNDDLDTICSEDCSSFE